MTLSVDPGWWKTLFDEVYLVTDARSVCDDALTRREADLFARLLPLEPDHRILDLCGGQGRHTLALRERGHAGCTVLDYSRHLLRRGLRRIFGKEDNGAFVNGDARNLPFPDGAFHHVLVLGNSLGYVADEAGDGADGAGDGAILAEIRRVLRPSGGLLVDVTDGDAVRDRLVPRAWHEIGDDVVVCRRREIRDGRVLARELVLSKENGLIRDRSYAIRLYDAEALAGLIADAGFDDVTVHTGLSVGAGEEDRGFMDHRMVVTARGA